MTPITHRNREIERLERELMESREELALVKADNGWFIEAVEYIRTIALNTRKGDVFGGTEEEFLRNQMSNIAQELLQVSVRNHPGRLWLEEYYKLEKQAALLAPKVEDK